MVYIYRQSRDLLTKSYFLQHLLDELSLSHLDRNKMVAAMQTTFSNEFSWMKIFALNFIEVWSYGSTWQ